jgi:HlyD family secretion protein
MFRTIANRQAVWVLAAAAAFGGYAPARPAGAGESSAVTVVTAQPLWPAEAPASGRIIAIRSARIGARVSGFIQAWGKNGKGEELDAGMSVRAGQVLFNLDSATFNVRVDMAQAALVSGSAALNNLKAGLRQEGKNQLAAAVEELAARIAQQNKDLERYERLVTVEKTMPLKRLEDVKLGLDVLNAQKKAADARLAEAKGPTETEVKMAEARVNEAEKALAAAQLDRNDSIVKAPFDGVITGRFRSIGDYASSGPITEVMELTDTTRLEADIRLPESFLDRVKADATAVTIKSPLLKEDLRLKVTRVVPQVDSAQGTFAVRVAVPPDLRGSLAPGAFVTVAVKLEEGGEGAIAPLSAIHTVDGRPCVFVEENGKMKQMTVVLGDRLTESAIIRSGVRAGQKLLAGPAAALKDGADLPADLKQ